MKYSIKEPENKKAFSEGIKAGIPIGLGYFAVAFSMGILAKSAGISVAGAVVSSLFCNASAGQYAGYMVIAGGGTVLGMALMILVANARYLLMSSALSQKLSPGTGLLHRALVGLYVTDEIFGVSMNRPGFHNPWFTYGCAIIASPCWALGAGLGCVAGSILPVRVVSALSVALFGMFLAVIIPPMKKDRVVMALVPVCFGLSTACTYLPGISDISEGLRTVILTVLISSVVALIAPRKDEEDCQ